jgi:secreted trypsin-like serine protease
MYAQILLMMDSALGETLELELKSDSSDLAVAGRIGNGAFAQLGQFPWHARLAMDFYYFCGGALIAKQWILTSAFCVAK